jgi:hypothetical protein
MNTASRHAAILKQMHETEAYEMSATLEHKAMGRIARQKHIELATAVGHKKALEMLAAPPKPSDINHDMSYSISLYHDGFLSGAMVYFGCIVSPVSSSCNYLSGAIAKAGHLTGSDRASIKDDIARIETAVAALRKALEDRP